MLNVLKPGLPQLQFAAKPSPKRKHRVAEPPESYNPEAIRPGRELERVLLRNDFYRDGYYRAFQVAIVAGTAGTLALLVAIMLLLRNPPAAIIAVDPQGKIIPVEPLDSPVYSDAELLRWAARAVTSALTFDFYNFQQVLETERSNFTESGFNQFLRALQSAQVISSVKTNKYVVFAQATAAPVLLANGSLMGRYVWKVQLPVLVTYDSSSGRISQPMVVTAIIQRDSLASHPHGVAIEQFVAVNGGPQQ